MATTKSAKGVKCWIRRQYCPCGELKCYIRYDEGDEDLIRSEDASSSLPVNADAEVEPPYLGQTFYTDDDAFEYYSNFAKKNGFAIRRESSKSSQSQGTYRRELVCYRAGVARHRKSAIPERQKNRKSTLCGCEAKMTIAKEFLGTVPQWTVKRFSNNHNHELLKDEQLRLLPAYRKIPDADRERILLLRRAGYSTSHIMKLLGSEKGGEPGNLPFIDRDVRNFLQSSSKKIEKGNDVSELLDLCKNVKERNVDFVYDFTLEGNDKLENLAWTYGDAIHAYEVFGDVVVLDTTFREITYDRLLGVWFGVDNHGKIIFFGAFLLQDETSRSFAWAFQAFLRFMKGRSPQTVLSDLDLGIRDAIISELPNSKYAVCIWHIFSKLSSWFQFQLGSRYEEFKSEFTRLFYLESVNDFEYLWNQMVSCFGLDSDKHIALLFAHRASWALPYIKGCFHAGMTRVECSKSIDEFLKEILSAQTCSESFFQKMGMIANFRNQGDEQDMEDVHMKTSMPMEEHASGILTLHAFNFLQHEIVMSMQYAAFETPSGLYLVRHHKQMEGGHLVSWSPRDEKVQCSCREYEFSGILCKHVLRVLALKNYFQIPEKYLPVRWRKESSLIAKSTQSRLVDWPQTFHSLTATLFAESSMTKERFNYVHAELVEVLNRVKHMHGSDGNLLHMESTPITDARLEDVANGGECNSIRYPRQSNT